MDEGNSPDDDITNSENVENEFSLDPNDIVEVIQLEGEDEDISHDVNDMDLHDEEEDDEFDEESEAMGGGQVKDDASMVFSSHTDAVFSVGIDPHGGKMAVTGGQDDKGYIWSVTDGECIMECGGHKDSVTSVGFSFNGTYAATADLSGLVKVWKVETKTEVWSFECSDIEWLQWHPLAPVLLSGTVDGDVWMWKIPDGDCKTFQGHGCTAGVGRILPDGKRVCVGYDDGAVKIWNMKTADVMKTISGREGHTSTVVCMDCHQDNSMVMTGSTDVTAKIINTSTGKVLSTFNCESVKEGDNSVEACGFCKQQTLAATGTLQGTLCIWDMPTQITRSKCQHEAGVVRLKWDPTAPLVYTACLDGVVRLWDGRNGQCVNQWSGHTDAILDVDLSRDGETLVTVSDDKTARVFSLHTPDR
ncbi:angio-associated migratory cell protein-like [Ylistrum balloti]|uniref:angio-associated migratory cell protein-like n=1 Tax=Ylistrum balloti TaxID=509963 RepID=UPI002905CB74|nr:angio-associated migratory cell protein-like [Ylistrum balloti]